MKLSDKALNELRTILAKEIGLKETQKMSEEDLNDLGVFFLSVMSTSIKRKNSLLV